MKRLTLILVIIGLLAISVVAQNKSAYTNLSTKSCREIKSAPDEGTEYQGECPGIGGYKLRFLESDLRQSIDVISPGRKRTQLGFWNVSGAFSHLGEKAEWRLKGKLPVALIVRFNMQQDPEDANKYVSVLIVSKISPSGSCITDVVEPMANQNETARKLADQSPGKPCKYAKE